MAKYTKDLMYVKERYNKRGELSLILHCSGKHPDTRDNKVYVKTYKVPSDLKGKKEIEAYRISVQLEFKAEVEKKSIGTLIGMEKKTLFKDFATEWVEDILKYRKLSHNYYLACKSRLAVMVQKLGNYYLHEITPTLIKNFCKWLSERTYKKAVVIVKESFKPLIKEKKLTFEKVAKACNISHATLVTALKIGNKINIDSANKIADFFNVSTSKYFDVEEMDIPYSQNSNLSIKSTLYSILEEAVSLRLVSSDVIIRDKKHKTKGTKSNKEIFNDNEVKQFIDAIKNETDIRKQVAFSMYIYLGLRNSELAGLEWQDIDFDTNEVNIQRNCLYLGSRFGTITKDTKTKNSNRTICMPACLVSLLKEYKEYWDKQKLNLGDLWANTDRLFCQSNGKDMVGSTLAGWLKHFEKTNGLKHVTPHGLRHTNITMLIKNGIDIKTVSGRVGHANVSTTLEIYSHFTKEADRVAASKLNEMFSFG